jgi:hypothetical protein
VEKGFATRSYRISLGRMNHKLAELENLLSSAIANMSGKIKRYKKVLRIDKIQEANAHKKRR